MCNNCSNNLFDSLVKFLWHKICEVYLLKIRLTLETIFRLSLLNKAEFGKEFLTFGFKYRINYQERQDKKQLFIAAPFDRL